MVVWEVAVQEEAHPTIAVKLLHGIKMEATVEATVVDLEAAAEVVVAEADTVVAEEAEVAITLHFQLTLEID